MGRGAIRDDDLLAGVLEQLEAPTDSLILAIGGHTLPVTRLSEPLWPRAPGGGLTKRDLLRYLARVSPYLLSHLDGRPVFVTRYPDGAEGHGFFQKVWERRPPFVRTVPVWSIESGQVRDYLLVANLATLLWLGQQAALELHVWFSRISAWPDGKRLGTRYAESEESLDASRLNYPDFLVVDLDSYRYSGREPAGGEPELNRRGFARVREIGHEVRRLAHALELEAFIKTSGRTGLHVYMPILRRFTFTEVRAMAETMGQFLRALRRRDVTLEWSVRRRTGRVFFDYNQNVRGKSLAAAYSPRPHPLGTVSMPIRWEELDGVYPTDFTIRAVPDLVERRGDAWAGILDAKANLERTLAPSLQAG